MGIFDRQKKFINDFENQIFVELKRTFESFDYVVKDFIVNKQLFREGIDGKGKKLEAYKRTTIQIKLRKGDPADRTTLKDKGWFHASILIDSFHDRVEISSNVPYDKYIINKYGKDVLRVLPEHFDEFFKNYYLPNLKKYVTNYSPK